MEIMTHQVHEEVVKAMLSQKRYKQGHDVRTPCFSEEPMDTF